MHLIIGGAFSGKRKRVREIYQKRSWVSAYEDECINDWKENWKSGTVLVLEGWEKWIVAELSTDKKNDQIRHQLKELLQDMLKEEQEREAKIVLVMLEIGRGIVPLDKNDRRLRDLMGWFAQDAAKLSDEVEMIWNGLTRTVK